MSGAICLSEYAFVPFMQDRKLFAKALDTLCSAPGITELFSLLHQMCGSGTCVHRLLLLCSL